MAAEDPEAELKDRAQDEQEEEANSLGVGKGPEIEEDHEAHPPVTVQPAVDQ